LLFDGTTIVAHSDSVMHSEARLLDRAGNRTIVAVYSEREPCSGSRGRNCLGKLTAAGVKNISWSFDWNNIGAAGREQSTRELNAAIKKLFGG